MSTSRGPRVSRAAAERLLDGRAAGPAPLTSLLRAAASPGTPAELATEDATLAAFRAARLAPSPTPVRRSTRMIKTAIAKLVAAKIATSAAVAAAATGGLTLAAATGNLPTPLQEAAHSVFGAPAAQPADTSTAPTGTDSAAGTDTPSAPATGGTAPGSDVPGSSAAGSDAPSSDAPSSAAPSSGAPSSDTPHPSLAGLCHAFRAGAGNNPGKALANPAFSVLVSAAGGKDAVAAFCTTLIGPAPTHHTGRPSSAPSHPSHAARPTRTAPTHPTGHPSTHPAGKPSTSHPAGKPSTQPAGGRPSGAPGHGGH